MMMRLLQPSAGIIGVDFAHYILFGGPGETEETVLETFALMDEVAPTAVIAMTGIRIFPGTPLHRQALAEGIITPETPCWSRSSTSLPRCGTASAIW